MRLTENFTGPIRIAARHSDLAKLQAYRVGEAIRAKFPQVEIQFSFRASLGDINLTDPLWKMPEKGVFTEDFLRDLIEGKADLVVHSWKDLPTEPRPETEIVATLPRADVRDLLLFKKDRTPEGIAKILTSSPRRAYNLRSFLKTHLPFEVDDIAFENVRGNIPTRLRKMIEQDVDGIIVAKAAMDRLLSSHEAEFKETRDFIRSVLTKVRFMVLPLSVNPTAAAQGAVAVEISKKASSDIREILNAINHKETFEAVEKERRILSSYGGGCHQKIGINVLGRGYGELKFLRGLTDAGEVLNEVSLSNSAPVTTSAFFPREGESGFFDRETLPREKWAQGESADFLWVARETAWPESFKQNPDAIVWSAGLRTWEKLAKRGVWVSGTSEGLGEDEPARLNDLLGEEPRWLKLTHEGSPSDQAMKVLATYRLKPIAKAPDLKGRTHFYWMSGSSFDRALELYPEIKNAHHASGPGLTHQHLKSKLSQAPAVYLDVETWRKSIQKESSK